jgi:hypothetical protein
MKSAAKNTARFGLLGLIVTVISAWTLAATRTPEWEHSRRLSISVECESCRLCMTYFAACFGRQRVYSERYGADVHGTIFPPEDMIVDDVRPGWALDRHIEARMPVPDFDELVQCSDDASGWPAPAMVCSVTQRTNGCTIEGGVAMAKSDSLDDLSFFGDEFRVLPLHPLWPGLLLNTAFYGVICWAVWFVPGAVRRGLRKRRGTCVRCGYDLRGGALAACPECGAGDR